MGVVEVRRVSRLRGGRERCALSWRGGEVEARCGGGGDIERGWRGEVEIEAGCRGEVER